MAEYRQIHNQIWKDSWFFKLESDLKLLFIYLFSNERSQLSGIYELPKEVIAFETRLPEKTIAAGLRDFDASGKVAYDFESSYAWVRKLLHYNARNTSSIKIQRHLARLMGDLSPACPYKAAWLEEHGSLIDTVCKPCLQEQEQEQEQEKETNTNTMAATAPPPSSSSSSSAVELFGSVLGQEPNQLDREMLVALAEEHEDWRRGLPEGAAGADVDGEGWVKAGIRAANAARHPDKPFTLAFVKAFLRRWREDGFQAGWKGDGEEVVFAEAPIWGKEEA
jgi:hypothetical protein